MKELSEIISHSIGGYSIANILSAILTLLVCLVVCRVVDDVGREICSLVRASGCRYVICHRL